MSRIVTNAEENGVISLHGLYKLWGSQTIANSITAFNNILSLHVEKHEDPSPTFQKLEKLMSDFFSDLSDNIKTAILLRTVDSTIGLGFPLTRVGNYQTRRASNNMGPKRTSDYTWAQHVTPSRLLDA